MFVKHYLYIVCQQVVYCSYCLQAMMGKNGNNTHKVYLFKYNFIGIFSFESLEYISARFLMKFLSALKHILSNMTLSGQQSVVVS